MMGDISLSLTDAKQTGSPSMMPASGPALPCPGPPKAEGLTGLAESQQPRTAVWSSPSGRGGKSISRHVALPCSPFAASWHGLPRATGLGPGAANRSCHVVRQLAVSSRSSGVIWKPRRANTRPKQLLLLHRSGKGFVAIRWSSGRTGEVGQGRAVRSGAGRGSRQEGITMPQD